MIDLDRAPLHGEGITVFADHADPARFHYLPDRPRLALAEDGTPEFSLLKYQLDPSLHEEAGGGLLSLTVDLAVAPERLARLERRLRRTFNLDRPPVLAPLLADKGSCEIVLIDRASRDDQPEQPGTPPTGGGGEPTTPPPPPAPPGLVERILGAATPSLYGDNTATFMAVLDAEGVSLVERALADGGLPVGVIYRLEVLGIRPALRAEITARWQDVYHYYENRLHGGQLLLGVDVGETVEELVRREAITIRVDELVPEDDKLEVGRRAVAEAQAYVLNELFRPTLGQTPPADDGGDDGVLATIGKAVKDLVGLFSITYTLREVDRNELKTFTYRLSTAQAERVTFAPQGALSVLATAVDLASRIVTVRAGPSPEMRFDVGASADLAAEGIERIEVELRYGDRREAMVLDAQAQRKQVTFFRDPALGDAIEYVYEVHFLPGGGGLGGLRRAPRVETDRRVIRIDPRALYRRVEVRAVAQGLSFSSYPRVIVDLRASAASTDEEPGFLVEETVTLDAAHAEARFSVRALLEQTVRLARRVRYVDAQGGELEVGWEDVDAGILVVPDPLPDVVDVQVLGAARWDVEVRRLVVELRPTGAPEQVTSRLLSREVPSVAWSFRPASKEVRGWEYRVTVHTVRGEVRTGEWSAGEGGRLVVGEGFARLREAKLMFVGKTLRDLGLLGVKVRFWFEDPEANLAAEQEVLVTDLKDPVAFTYPVASLGRAAFHYQLTYVGTDGRLDPKEPVTTSDLLVLCALR